MCKRGKIEHSPNAANCQRPKSNAATESFGRRVGVQRLYYAGMGAGLGLPPDGAGAAGVG